MADLARGTVADRPWGRTLAALGLRGVTGQVTVISDAKPYRIAFSGGAVTGATSPLTSDAAVRVALTGSLISSTQVADISRRQATQPTRDEVEVIAEAARLAPEQALRLRRRVIAQRAARTFALLTGDFVVREEIELPIVEGTELDVRSVIFLGAKQMLPEGRLASDLKQFGSWFQLRTEAVDDLPQFGFGSDEQAVLALLNRGVELTELEGQADISPQIARAVVYALASCNALAVDGAQARASQPAPPRAPVAPPLAEGIDAPTMRGKHPTRAPTPVPVAAPVAPPAAPIAPPAAPIAPPAASSDPDPDTVARARPTPAPPSGAAPAAARPAKQSRAIAKPADPAHKAEVEALIKARLGLIEGKQRGDHFQLLGVDRHTQPNAIRDAYFSLARSLHPDRLSALGIVDEQKKVQRLFAEINTAFAVLNDPAKRGEYVDILNRGGEAAIRADQQKAEEMAMRILESEEAFRRGEQALKRDSLSTAIRELERAIQLNPDEADYHATLAWAQFAAAPDKMAVAKQTRATLERAIQQAPQSVTGKFFLGRVERMLGKDKEALALFQQVLERQPSHHEASSEVRVLEARLAGGDKGGGLFGRTKR